MSIPGPDSQRALPSTFVLAFHLVTRRSFAMQVPGILNLRFRHRPITAILEIFSPLNVLVSR